MQYVKNIFSYFRPTDTRSPLLSESGTNEKMSSMGRKFSEKTCLNSVMAITALVGATILVFGLLVLASSLAQSGKLASSSFLTGVHKAAVSIATKTGIDVFTVMLSSTTVGGTVLFGALGVIIHRHFCAKSEVDPRSQEHNANI